MNIKSGSNLTKVRKNNLEAILGTIYQQAPITRNEIARQLDVTLPTVTTTIRPLLETGILREVPLPSSEGIMGRKAFALDFVENAGFVMGMEWNPLGIFVCITNLRGKILAKIRKKVTVQKESYQNMLMYTKDVTEELLLIWKGDRTKLLGAGWATPGIVDPDQGKLVRSSMSYVNWENENVCGDLENLLQMPVCVENHVRVRAIRQDMFERKVRPEIYLYYFAQMGISCCVMADGEPFGKGSYGIGDIGHTVMDAQGPVCQCGKRGCLQAICGEGEIRRIAAELIEKGGAGYLKCNCEDPVSPEVHEIAAAIDQGDEDLMEAILPALQYMAVSIGSIADLLNPRLVVLDYALFGSHRIQEFMTDEIRKNYYFVNEMDLQVEYVQADRYTGAQGACALAIGKFLIGGSVI